MGQNFPNIPFERYADDTICHCTTEKQAKFLFYQIRERLDQCKLRLNEEKTKIVFCKSYLSISGEDSDNISFDFLGFTFRPRSAVDPRTNSTFVGLLPAIGKKSVKKINATIREWTRRRQTRVEISDIANMINLSIQGWINYYGAFYPSLLKKVLKNVNQFLFIWAKRKYKSLSHKRNAIKWICNVTSRDTACLHIGGTESFRLVPFEIENISMNKKSRMTGDCHVRFREGLSMQNVSLLDYKGR